MIFAHSRHCRKSQCRKLRLCQQEYHQPIEIAKSFHQIPVDYSGQVLSGLRSMVHSPAKVVAQRLGESCQWMLRPFRSEIAKSFHQIPVDYSGQVLSGLRSMVHSPAKVVAQRLGESCQWMLRPLPHTEEAQES